ncbi:hypothetical protein FRB95_006330 [Tulasnella sp. JGI-2019a]|nr:hypothetical protein FRB95_006330 [Tulasnella sp. JGI-2019a]
MPDNQTEAGASAEGGPSEIRVTGVHPPSTKRKRDEQDDEDMAVGAPAKGKMRESFGEEVGVPRKRSAAMGPSPATTGTPTWLNRTP